MSTLLINPSERSILQNAGDRMPLGLLYIAKSLERHNEKVRVYDLNHDSEKQLFDDINRDKPELIGVSCLTSPLVNESRRLLHQLHSTFPQIKLIVGGYHSTVKPGDFKDLAEVIPGEGEYAILGLKDEGLKGLTPARHLVKDSNYNLMMDGMRTATMITSRGCPNNCIFCGNLSHKVREHDLKDIESELEYIANHNYKAVYFLDDVFTINKKRAITISEMCKDRGLKFRLTTRANYLTNDLVSRLSQNGLDIVSMGVESGNPSILEAVGKNQTKQQIRDAVTMCHTNGVKTKGFYILGLPGETEKTAKQTIRFAEELRNLGMDYHDFYSLVCYPGTALYNDPSKYGIKILTHDYSKYLQVNKEGVAYPTCETKDLKADRIYELLLEARRRLK